MSSSIGINSDSFNSPQNISPQAFEGDTQLGGKVKASSVLGSVAGISGSISAISPVLAPIAGPIAAIAGIGSAIAKLFGGGLTQQELDMVTEVHRRVQSRRDIRGVVGSPAN